MRRALAVLAGATLALGALALARAQLPLLFGLPTNPQTISWPAGTTITYRLNNQIGPGMPNLQAGSLPVPAIDQGFASIGAAAGLTFQNGGPTPLAEASVAPPNLVSFASTPTNNALLQGLNGLSLVWFNSGSGQITGFDVLGSSSAVFSTVGGASFFDLEGAMAHEVGHVVGMDHAAQFDATLHPVQFPGSLRKRDLAPDDHAGIAALYGLVPPGQGSVTGSVQRPAGVAVAGAHVFLVDAITGRVGTGTLSRPDGSFLIPGVKPGLHHLYVEPLDGPVTPALLTGGLWSTVSIDTAFRPAVLGGVPAPQVIVVGDGQTVAAGSVTVNGPAAALDVSQVFFNSAPTPVGALASLESAAPYAGFVGILGPGVHLPLDASFEVTGPFHQITGASTWAQSGAPFDQRILPLAVAGQAPAGAYLMRIADVITGELAVFGGCLEVLPGASPAAFAAPYGVGCAGSNGPLLLTASGPPALGSSGFSVSVTGTLPGSTAYFVLSLRPDHVVLGPACALGIDLAHLLLPLPGLARPAGATTTLALPIPALPALAGVDVYVQVLGSDPAAPAGFALSNALQLHLE